MPEQVAKTMYTKVSYSSCSQRKLTDTALKILLLTQVDSWEYIDGILSFLRIF